MSVTINGTTGVAGVAGSASTPALQGTDSNTGVFYPAADVVALGTNGTEAMRVDSSQNVGVGTSSPSTYANGAAPTLVVGTGNNWVVAQPRTDGPSGAANGVRIAGNYLTNPKPGAAFWIGAQGGSGQRGMLAFFTKDTDDNTNDPTERARIDSSGNFLFNKTSTAATGSGVCFQTNDTAQFYRGGDGQALQFFRSSSQVGSISVTGTATAYNTSSDYRLKHDIAPMTGALAKVAALKPVTYKWNLDDSEGEGFIAHELQAVVPGCVTGEKDEVDAKGNPVYQGIDTSFLVATLTAAIQELKAELDAANARIAALEAK